METLTHWKKLTNPNYIGAYSLQPGEERCVEIISVGQEKVKGSDGKDSLCTVAKLKNEKPFVLNRTNCKTLTRISGTPFIEKWNGLKVIVYAEKVKAFGDIVDALRIKPAQPIFPELNPESPKWVGAIECLRKGETTIEAIEKSYKISAANKTLIKNILNTPS